MAWYNRNVGELVDGELVVVQMHPWVLRMNDGKSSEFFRSPASSPSLLGGRVRSLVPEVTVILPGCLAVTLPLARPSALSQACVGTGGPRGKHTGH